jgi:hypothetical protein
MYPSVTFAERQLKFVGQCSIEETRENSKIDLFHRELLSISLLMFSAILYSYIITDH